MIRVFRPFFPAEVLSAVPLYEYQCAGSCGRFEVLQKYSDAALTTCPTCGREVQKLLSSPAIQFKGTGWYVTDYAKKSGGGESKKSESGGETSSSTSSASSNSKDSSAPSSTSSTSSSGSGGSTSKS